MNCNLSGHTSWHRLYLAFLGVCKCMEGTDPEHTYNFFPSCDAWTWEQEPGFNDLRLPSWHGPLDSMPNWHSKDWQDEHLTPHMAGSQHARYNGWPGHLNVASSTEQVGMVSQGRPWAASMQSRLDEFPLTAISSESHSHVRSKCTALLNRKHGRFGRVRALASAHALCLTTYYHMPEYFR